jgi:hypothetical protein
LNTVGESLHLGGPAGMLEVLRKIFGANALADEFMKG